MNTDWLLVNTTETAQRAAEYLRQASILGIDTEYDSFRYFREKLCNNANHCCPNVAYPGFFSKWNDYRRNFD